MKKNLIIMGLLAAFAATGCTEAENFAGGDKPEPVVTIYDNSKAKTYQTGFRAVPNTSVEAVYILTETTFAREEAIAANGEAAYLQYVRENGVVYEGQEPIDYMANPDNNSTSDKAYDASDDLMGYITTTIVADGKGKTSVYTINKDCYSTSLTITNLMNNKLGDWAAVGTVTVQEVWITSCRFLTPTSTVFLSYGISLWVRTTISRIAIALSSLGMAQARYHWLAQP